MENILITVLDFIELCMLVGWPCNLQNQLHIWTHKCGFFPPQTMISVVFWGIWTMGVWFLIIIAHIKKKTKKNLLQCVLEQENVANVEACEHFKDPHKWSSTHVSVCECLWKRTKVIETDHKSVAAFWFLSALSQKLYRVQSFSLHPLGEGLRWRIRASRL